MFEPPFTWYLDILTCFLLVVKVPCEYFSKKFYTVPLLTKGRRWPIIREIVDEEEYSFRRLREGPVAARPCRTDEEDRLGVACEQARLAP